MESSSSSFESALAGFGSFRNAVASYSTATSTSTRGIATTKSSSALSRSKLAQPPRFYERFHSSATPSTAHFDLDPPARSLTFSQATPHDLDDSITAGTFASVSPAKLGQPSIDFGTSFGIGGGGGGGGGGGSSMNEVGQGPAISGEEQQRLVNEIKADLDVGSGSFVDRFFGDVGVSALAKIMQNNTSVKNLDLRGNRIGGVGAVALAEMLECNTSLESLCLEWNSLGKDAASFGVLAAAVGKSGTLKVSILWVKGKLHL